MREPGEKSSSIFTETVTHPIANPVTCCLTLVRSEGSLRNKKENCQPKVKVIHYNGTFIIES